MKRCLVVAVLLLSSFIIGAPGAVAAVDVGDGWTMMGPYGGLGGVSPDLHTPGIIWGNGNMYRTTDAGASWQLYTGVERGSIYPDPNVPGRLFSITYPTTLNISYDNGVTWSPVAIPRHPSDMAFTSSANVIYGPTGGSYVNKSVDGGLTWVEYDYSASYGVSQIRGFAADPQDPNRFFFANASDVYRSDDGGETLVVDPSFPGFGNYYINKILFSSDNQVCFVSTGNQTMRSADGRVTFQDVANIGRVDKDPFYPGRYYGISPSTQLGARLYSYISTDSGATWTQLRYSEAGNRTFFTDWNNPQKMYLVENGFFWIRDDEVSAFRKSTAGILGPDVQDVHLDADGTYWAASKFGGLQKSPDEGFMWEHVEVGDTSWMGSVEVSPFDTNDVSTQVTSSFYVTSGGAFRSLDGGLTWTRITWDSWANNGQIYYDPVLPGHLYHPRNNGLYESIDNGATWTHHEISDPGTYAYIYETAPSNPNVRYLISSGGNVHSSTDGGASWSFVSTLPYFHVNGRYPLLISGTNPSVISYDKYFSVDSGQTWDTLDFVPMAIDPVAYATLYAVGSDPVTYEFGLLASYDLGQSWQLISTAPDGTRYNFMYVKSRTPDQLDLWLAGSSIFAKSFVLDNDIDGDGDGYSTVSDCNDGDAAINPGAIEIWFDGIDQDCNGYDLTIAITLVDYNTRKDALKVEATSELGTAAGLWLEYTGFSAPMDVNKNGSRWSLTIEPAGGDPGTITVIGVEGSVTASTSGEPPCEPVPEICTDGTDNDCDGLVDYEDVADCPPPPCQEYPSKDVCKADPNCRWEGSPKNGTCVDDVPCTPTAPDENGFCGDGQDNDCDGTADCDDDECVDDTLCLPPDCSLLAEAECKDEPSCRWNKKDQVCVNR